MEKDYISILAMSVIWGYFSLISEECKCSKNPFFWIQLAMITLYFTFIFCLQGAIKSFLLLKIVLLEDGQISV